MAEITIRFRHNAATGRRELVVHLESDSDVLGHEHRGHATGAEQRHEPVAIRQDGSGTGQPAQVEICSIRMHAGSLPPPRSSAQKEARLFPDTR